MILQYFRILQYHWSIFQLAIICCICHKILYYVSLDTLNSLEGKVVLAIMLCWKIIQRYPTHEVSRRLSIIFHF